MKSISAILKETKTNSFILNCEMPLGYAPVLPLLKIVNDQLCLVVPFARYKMTGEPDRTLVYPIRYAVTLVLPENRPVAFQNLAFEERFAQVQFSNPVGYFRHEAIKHLKKAEYQALRAELLSLYDKLAGALLGEGEYTDQDEERMQTLLKMLVEPSLLPFYKALDEDFYRKYLV